MKNFVILIFTLLLFQFSVFATEQQVCDVSIFSDKNLFGLKDCNENIIVKPIYKKMIRLENKAFIFQKGYKYGLLSNSGEILVEPKYRHAERMLGHYAKLGNSNDFGIYNENGEMIVPPLYSKIDILYGKMFLTCRKYKYGIFSFDGFVILDNQFDDIYMPDKKTMRIKYLGEWYQIEQIDKETDELQNYATKFTYDNKDYKITYLLADAGLWSGYSALTFGDYLMKLISSLSPAYEDTIDELMLSHGTDSVPVIMNFSWLPKFPATFAQKYYFNYLSPYNGPFSEIRNSMKKNLK